MTSWSYDADVFDQEIVQARRELMRLLGIRPPAAGKGKRGPPNPRRRTELRADLRTNKKAIEDFEELGRRLHTPA